MTYAKEGFTGFESLCVDFRKCHKNSVNVALHFITSPLGLIFGLSLINKLAGENVGNTVAFIYAATMFLTVSFRLSLANAIFTIFVTYAAGLLNLEWVSLCGLLIASYMAQDYAHFLTGEPTLESQYIQNPNGVYLLIIHTYYLIPLLLDAYLNMPYPFLSWLVAHNTMFTTKLDPTYLSNADIIRKWVLDQRPTQATTTHWWYEKLDLPIRSAFAKLAESSTIQASFQDIYDPQTYNVERLTGMDEIYVTCPKFNGNSDTVFFMKHVDGPYWWWPFCAVYRCMFAVSPNTQITTHFPQADKSTAITTGEIFGFDFNREVHYITSDPTKKINDFRICLKVHYVVYPKAFGIFGRLCGFLTTEYDVWARNLFLSTLQPKSFFDWFKSYQILVTTAVVAFFHEHMGPNNLVYLISLAATSLYFKNYAMFLIGTSFVHYLMYIATYYVRGNINYYNFVRNVVLFKTLALGNLTYLYLRAFKYDANSLTLLGVGYGISFLAFLALGLERTYFGVELGRCEPKWITQFPYGFIPHPMILGSCLGLIGFHMGPGVGGDYPWLVPCHIMLYLAHMTQEAFDWKMETDKPNKVKDGPMSAVRGDRARSRSRSVVPA